MFCISNNIVGKQQFAKEAVGTAQLASNPVSTAKISLSAITTNLFVGGAVTTPKIASGAVTIEKFDKNIDLSGLNNSAFSLIKQTSDFSGFQNYLMPQFP